MALLPANVVAKKLSAATLNFLPAHRPDERSLDVWAGKRPTAPKRVEARQFRANETKY